MGGRDGDWLRGEGDKRRGPDGRRVVTSPVENGCRGDTGTSTRQLLRLRTMLRELGEEREQGSFRVEIFLLLLHHLEMFQDYEMLSRNKYLC